MIMVSTQIQPKRILIDVDTQNHFFLDNGPIRVQNPRNVLDNIERVLGWARSKRIRLISTMQIKSNTALCADVLSANGFSLRKPSRISSDGWAGCPFQAASA